LCYEIIKSLTGVLFSFEAAYCASKAAVVNITKQIALDYAVDKIHCNAICPGCE